jgi:hypothetical protein
MNKPDLRDVLTEDEISEIVNALSCASWYHPTYRSTHEWFIQKVYPSHHPTQEVTREARDLPPDRG